jgi:pyridoxal phosphate enzyme (YggS family)
VQAAGRDRQTVTLIAASKTQTPDALRAANAAGIDQFGENYLQEALEKVSECKEMQATWHFIGALQGNKTRQVAENFDWVHTVDRAKIARRLNDQCSPDKCLNICLQVNIDEDPNKAGVVPAQAATLLESTQGLDRLQVRGLMTILHPQSDPAEGYSRLRQLFEELRPLTQGQWDSLSMGMSGDCEAAIAAGATHVRVGTAIFGPRNISR